MCKRETLFVRIYRDDPVCIFVYLYMYIYIFIQLVSLYIYIYIYVNKIFFKIIYIYIYIYMLCCTPPPQWFRWLRIHTIKKIISYVDLNFFKLYIYIYIYISFPVLVGRAVRAATFYDNLSKKFIIVVV